MGMSFQTQIRNLHQAGVATHIVENADAVDPIFALSKVRDFPEISFAAAFEDGSIVLGCHGDLPEPLVNIANPIPPSEEPQTEVSTPLLDTLVSRLDSISAALDQHAHISGSMNDRIDQIEHKLQSGHDAIAAKLTDVSALDAIQKQIAALPDMLESAHDLNSVRKQTEDIAKTVTRIEATNRDDAPDRLTQILASFEERMITQTASQLPPEAIVDITTRQDAMLRALDSVSSDLGVVTTQQSSLADAAAQTFDVDKIADRLSVLEDIDDKLSHVQGAIQALTETLNHASHAAPEEAPFNQLSMQINALATEVTAVRQRPDPTIDMTEQRLGFARFQTAMGTVLARLETETERLCVLEPNGTDPAINQLSQQIDALTAQISPLNQLGDQISALGADLQTLPKKSEEIAAAVADMKQRPDPVLDLTEQRRCLAHFANAIGTAIARLETVAAQFDEDKTLNEILARLDTNQASAKPDTLSNELANLLQTQRHEIIQLRNAVTTHLEQPGPVLDLTMQRASLAQFGTAMGAMLNRLEAVAGQIEAVPDGIHVLETPTETAPARQTHEQTPINFADDRISLEALRHSFAELIAKQIMDNARSDSKTEDCRIHPEH
ncbi:hypothetical protein MWU60_00805 [Yoonia sp. F2084L]|uniref:hypothetical protein n=1 Tax=Yoonia sp. F2084L TaxID=2926419 RepID=UPI001FF3BF72|nr:hypothetical protein [Yoonia sp. F2084L]MCK0094093.1 hypothetical protein [Yoonia sp. F2084L]